MKPTLDVWKRYPVEVGQSLTWPVGNAVFHLLHTGREWKVASQAAGTDATDITWKRWSTGAEERVVEPIPMTPDRSVIVRPEAPIWLAPGHTAVYHVSIPLWVRLAAGADRALILCDEPTLILSSIWFGEPTAGELCYSLRTRARREDSDDDLNPSYRAVCRVTMANHAAEPVAFQRLCLPARYLQIYAGESRLWTDDVAVGIESETVNRVRITGRPDTARGDAALGPARAPMPGDHLLQRGLQTIRSLF